MLRSLFIALLLAPACSAQLTIKGPAESKPGTLQTIVLTDVKGKDLKIECFLDGVSSKSNWNLFKNIEDQYVILVLPQPEDSKYNFVFAINNVEKTYLATHTLTVLGKSKPTVPEDALADKIKAAYQSSPDAATLAAMVQVFESVAKLDYDNQEQMQTVLKETAAKSLKPEALRTVRDIIGDYFIESLGTNPKAKPNLQPYKNILRILKGL